MPLLPLNINRNSNRKPTKYIIITCRASLLIITQSLINNLFIFHDETFKTTLLSASPPIYSSRPSHPQCSFRFKNENLKRSSFNACSLEREKKVQLAILVKKHHITLTSHQTNWKANERWAFLTNLIKINLAYTNKCCWKGKMFTTPIIGLVRLTMNEK